MTNSSIYARLTVIFYKPCTHAWHKTSCSIPQCFIVFQFPFSGADCESHWSAPKAASPVRGMVCESEYELIEEIGRGSYGKVYQARHESSDIHAIKVSFLPYCFASHLQCCRCWPTASQTLCSANYTLKTVCLTLACTYLLAILFLYCAFVGLLFVFISGNTLCCSCSPSVVTVAIIPKVSTVILNTRLCQPCGFRLWFFFERMVSF